MNRRDFISTTAAAAAVPALGAVNLLAEPGRGLKKSLKFGMIRVEGDLTARFQAAKTAGFDGVEMDSPNGFDVSEVVAARDKVGIALPGVIDSVHWGQPLSHPDAAVRKAGLTGLLTALKDCKAYGGTTVLLVPAVVNKSISYADAYKRSQEEVRKALPLASELGVKIAFENVWNQFLMSPLEAARYVDEFESPMVGWYFDVGNIVNYGWPEQWIDILGHRILKLDIKEFSRKKRDAEGLSKGFDVEIGEGDCDWPAVMKALDRIGYRGWASAEVGGGGPKRLSDIAQRMDRAFAS